MYIAPDYSRVSIREHTISRNTDQLYDPLRQTFSNPQSIQRHSALTPVATRSSFVSKEYKILTPQQLQRLEQNIYIPNTMLYASNNLDPIKNERFVAVDASERILGPPITPEELQRIKTQGFKKQEVVYEMKRPEESMVRGSAALVSSHSIHAAPSPKSQKLNSPAPLLPIQQQVTYEYQPVAERYTVQNYDDYGKNSQEYKYNLFSIIDEPVNKCRQFGLSGCTSCPGNEVIASRNRPLSLTWK